MCKKVYERKNVKYGIKILFLNGNIENVNLVDKGVDDSIYKEVIKFYNMLKNNCKKVNKIEFVGFDKHGMGDVLFTKDFVTNNINKYKEMDSYNLIKDMMDIIDVLKIKNAKSLNKIKSAVDKKQDVMLHKIETFDLLELEDNEDLLQTKATLFDKLKEIRNIRRRYKIDINVMAELEENVDLKNLYDKLKGVLYRQKNKDIKYLTDKLVEELKIMKEVSYKSDKQRVKYIRQLKGKYEKIVNDESHQKLICYNNANC